MEAEKPDQPEGPPTPENPVAPAEEPVEPQPTTTPDERPSEATSSPGRSDIDVEAVRRAREQLEQAAGGH